MLETQRTIPRKIIGPLGEALTLDKLPPVDTKRWVVRRKAEVVAAVEGGLLTIDQACKRYSISVEELASWRRAVHLSGLPGLRVTRLQKYREFYQHGQSYDGRPMTLLR